jgi:hypothetical protein
MIAGLYVRCSGQINGNFKSSKRRDSISNLFRALRTWRGGVLGKVAKLEEDRLEERHK